MRLPETNSPVTIPQPGGALHRPVPLRPRLRPRQQPLHLGSAGPDPQLNPAAPQRGAAEGITVLHPIGNAPAGRVTAMAAVARHARVIAHPGQSAALAAHLPGTAEGLASDSGCVLYLVNREKANPDTIWATEIWRSQADLDALPARIRSGERAAPAKTMVKDWQMIELDSRGGKGLQLLLTDQRHMTKEKCASASTVYGV